MARIGRGQYSHRLITSSKDENGDLSRSNERRATKDSSEAQMLSELDTDGDGQQSNAERSAARDIRKAQMQAALDVNGDGVVSDAASTGFDKLLDEMLDEIGEQGGKGHGQKENKR